MSRREFGFRVTKVLFRRFEVLVVIVNQGADALAYFCGGFGELFLGVDAL